MPIATAARPRNWGREIWADFDRFWFGAGSATTLGVFRILMGLANLGALILLLPFLEAWYSEAGFTPLAVTDRSRGPISQDFVFFGVHAHLPFQVPFLDVFAGMTYSPLFLTFYAITMLAAILTTLGLWTRVSSIVLAVGVVSLQHRNELVLHGGDTVVRLGAIYMAIAPSGKACSLDRLIGLWKGRLRPGPALISVWPQRIIQYNLALIYFTTWWVKLDGTMWRDGTAAWYPPRLHEFVRFWIPPFMLSTWMTPVLTYATVAVELALGTIVFWRPARSWVLGAGLLLHGWIEYSMNIPMFAYSICCFYIAFYDGDELSAWAIRLGRRLRRLRLVVPVAATALEAGPALAVRATDPLSLVVYEPIEGAAPPDARLARRLYARSPGAWILGIVPGLWRRMVFRALQQGDAV